MNCQFVARHRSVALTKAVKLRYRTGTTAAPAKAPLAVTLPTPYPAFRSLAEWRHSVPMLLLTLLPDEVTRVTQRDETLFVDAASGAVVRRIRGSDRTAGDRFLAVQHGLHTGEMLGAARALLFIGGLLPAVLVVTGTMMWLRQRRRKYVATSTGDVAGPAGKNPENATAASALRR